MAKTSKALTDYRPVASFADGKIILETCVARRDKPESPWVATTVDDQRRGLTIKLAGTFRGVNLRTFQQLYDLVTSLDATETDRFLKASADASQAAAQATGNRSSGAAIALKY